MKLMLHEQDKFSNYARKKIFDFLFYGVSEQDFINMIGDIKISNYLSHDSFFHSLHAYILSEPITLSARKRIYVFLQYFRNCSQEISFPEHSESHLKINQIFSLLSSKENVSTLSFYKEQLLMRSIFGSTLFDHYNDIISIVRDLELLCACSENTKEEAFQKYLRHFLLSQFTLDSICVMECECPPCFHDSIFIKRILFILTQNAYQLQKKESLSYFGENQDQLSSFSKQNQEIQRILS